MIYILTAILQDGTPFIIEQGMDRSFLKAWRDKNHFLCPQCRARVQLKVGSVRIPHFAHEADSTCSSRFSEGESMAHLYGKQLLYELFDRLQKQPLMEPLIAQLNQRPDLLIISGEQKVPIEFQCSRIDPQEKNRRTDGYRSVGMCPVWLLQTPPKYENRVEGMDIFSFSAFQQQFFTTKNSPSLSLITLSPNTKKFHYFNQLLHIEGNRFIGHHRKLSTVDQIFPFASPKPLLATEIKKYTACYRMHRSTFLQRSIFISRKGVQDPFLRTCYEMRLHPSDLSAVIGVPVRYSSAFTVHDCVWQVELLRAIDGLHMRANHISKEKVKRFARQYAGDTNSQVAACLAYVEFLDHIQKTYSEPLTNDEIEKEITQLLVDRFLAKRIEN